MEDWQRNKSTKVDICARICLHLLSRDDAPSMVFENGGVVFPPVPVPAPGERVSQTIKILIYQEFPSFGPMVRDVRVLLRSFRLLKIQIAYLGFHALQNKAPVYGWTHHLRCPGKDPSKLRRRSICQGPFFLFGRWVWTKPVHGIHRHISGKLAALQTCSF